MPGGEPRTPSALLGAGGLLLLLLLVGGCRAPRPSGDREQAPRPEPPRGAPPLARREARLPSASVAAAPAPSEDPAGAPSPSPVAVWVEADGPWTVIPPDEAADAPAEVEGEGTLAPEADAARLAAAAAAPRPPDLMASRPARPALAVPSRRFAAPAEAPADPERRSRERYLAHPTHVRAHEITFYCPRGYLREVRLDGLHVTEPAPDRREATGGARLLCRELTLEAERILLKIRDEPDVQLTARGEVAFVSRQGGQVFHENGARLLLVKNAQVTPLR